MACNIYIDVKRNATYNIVTFLAAYNKTSSAVYDTINVLHTKANVI